jgi:hypothetical protein
MQQLGVTSKASHGARETSLLKRFAAKLVVDVLPAALASLIVGCLLTQYQFGHASLSRPLTAQAGPATAEMMQLVRDEHAAIMAYLKAQAAAEQSRYAAEDAADAQAVADARAAAAANSVTTVAVVPPPVVTHAKAFIPTSAAPAAPAAAAASAPSAPLAIALAVRNDGGAPAPAAVAAAAAPQQPASLLAKTIDIRDHVIHVTLHAVSAIGGIPNWIASLGDRIGNGSSSGSAQPYGTSS